MRVFGLFRPLLTLALLVAPWTARAGDEKPIDRLLGETVSDFTLTNARDGKPFRLYDLEGHKAAVLVFTGIECPIGDLYLPRLVELQKKYADQGVAVVAINSNTTEGNEAVARHAEEFGLNFPVLQDKDGQVAGRLEVVRTCEAILVDGEARIRYRGAIDDQYGYGTRKDRPVRPYLVEAVEAVLANKEPETTATSVAGCPIDWVETKVRPLPRISAAPEVVVEAMREADPDIDASSLGEVTYSKDVASLLQNRCQSCHRPGQVGPFSLLTYDDAKRHADGIHEVVDARRMPPWHADPRYGHFANERRLTARERAVLTAWVEQGTPRGDTALEPAAREWPEGWSIGTPDLVFEMPEPYTVHAENTLPYQHFRVPTNFTEDRWVRAIEPRPGDRSVVHHIIIYLQRPGVKIREMDDLEHLAAYAPGDLPTVLPEGLAKEIPAGSNLIFEIHYTPVGKVKIDRSSVGMIFSKEPPKQRVKTVPVLNTRFKIPAGADNHEVTASSGPVPADTTLLGFLPHMHLRGKDFRYTAVYPDGTSEILLSVPRYDFAWQSYYWLKEPKLLPKGTTLNCVAHFDNSSNNPALSEKDIETTVTWGPQTWEEMMIGYVDTLEPIEPKEKPSEGATSGE